MAEASQPQERAPSQRKLVYVGRPPKPISEMSDEELDAYACVVYEAVAERIKGDLDRNSRTPPPSG